MRSAWILSIMLLAAGFAAPFVQAAGGKTFLTDATGDTSLGAFGGPVPIPAQDPSSASADLVSLDILESDESVTMVLGVAGFSTSQDQDLYDIHFEFRNMSYNAIVQHQRFPTGDGYTGGYLTAMANDDQGSMNYYSYGSYVADLHVTQDKDKNTLSFEIPKAYILDGAKRLPNRGDTLTNVFVTSQNSLTLFQGGLAFTDRMPDTDAGTFTIAIGDVSTGHLVLQSGDRVRVSNGGAATFVYKVTLKNTGERDETVDLALRDLPLNWNGTVQTPIKIPGNAEKTFTVLASVPFAHVHGGFSAFNLTAASQSDPGSASTLRLGILHSPIPQPAGHHSELYLHPEISNDGLFNKVSPRTGAIMNTEASKAEETAAEITSYSMGNQQIGWYIPLNPGLQMGLDFDTNKTGTLAGNIIGHQPGSAKITAKLVLVRTDAKDRNTEKPIVLAKSNSADITLDLNNAAPFSLQMTPTPESDYIAYAPHQNLVLQIFLDSSNPAPIGPNNFCCIGNTQPTLKVDGFKFSLPLNEYADKLTGISEAASALDLKADGPVEKIARPGALMTYQFTITNTGLTADTFTLETAGTDAKLGSLVPNGDVDLAPKETKSVTLGVRVPGDAHDGQTIEVLIFAHAKTDPSKMALARTKTTAMSTGNATGDEAKVFLAAKQDSKKSPGPDALLVIGAIGAALVVVARRRK